MRILVVSRNFRKDVETMVHGVFKRFHMFLDAIQDIAQIDILYFVPSNISTAPDSVAHYQNELEKHYKVRISLFLCPLKPGNGLAYKMMTYVGGAFSIMFQPEYASLSGRTQLNAIEACLANKPDAVLVHRLGSMIPFFLTQTKLPPIFFDLDDVEHVAFMRRIKNLPGLLPKLRNTLLYPALCNGEKRAISLARNTFVCSDHDLDYLQKKWRTDGLVKIPNAISVPPEQDITVEPNLLFIGSYAYKPNLEAANYLIKKIWPKIHEQMPAARLIIAGSSPENIVLYHTGVDGVSFTGFVDDLDALYKSVRVVCVPILSGSGTRIKILEAAAYGKPVVSTKIGAEGLEMQDGDNILLRDDPQAFADACVFLLNDLSTCIKIGSEGRNWVAQSYDRGKVLKMIRKVFLEALSSK